VPVFLHGPRQVAASRFLPAGAVSSCDVFVGEALYGERDTHAFMDLLAARMEALAAEGSFPPWE
jgi:hypothetical protein